MHMHAWSLLQLRAQVMIHSQGRRLCAREYAHCAGVPVSQQQARIYISCLWFIMRVDSCSFSSFKRTRQEGHRLGLAIKKGYIPVRTF